MITLLSSCLIVLIINTVHIYLCLNKSNVRLNEIEKEIIKQQIELFTVNYKIDNSKENS